MFSWDDNEFGEMFIFYCVFPCSRRPGLEKTFSASRVNFQFRVSWVRNPGSDLEFWETLLLPAPPVTISVFIIDFFILYSLSLSLLPDPKIVLRNPRYRDCRTKYTKTVQNNTVDIQTHKTWRYINFAKPEIKKPCRARDSRALHKQRYTDLQNVLIHVL